MVTFQVYLFITNVFILWLQQSFFLSDEFQWQEDTYSIVSTTYAGNALTAYEWWCNFLQEICLLRMRGHTFSVVYPSCHTF